MPSPFPGMDPFLEHPDHFPILHNRMISEISDTLQAALPEPYYAVFGIRTWVEVSQRFIEPDVEVLRARRSVSRRKRDGTAGVATAKRRTRPLVIRVPSEERRETYVEIRTRLQDAERVVTSVEILSPVNKTPGERGRDEYLRKQREILASKTHLVEIDLLRGGTHATAVPEARLQAAAGDLDYHVCVHRFDKAADYFVYPWLLEEQLPEVAIPLLPRDRPVLLDLQAVFEKSYDVGPYRRRVNYRDQALTPAPSPDRLGWVARLLRARGVERTGS